MPPICHVDSLKRNINTSNSVVVVQALIGWLSIMSHAADIYIDAFHGLQRRIVVKIEQPIDIQESLLIGTNILTGSRSYIGSQELGEALDEKIIDVLISRRMLRHWKDLEPG